MIWTPGQLTRLVATTPPHARYALLQLRLLSTGATTTAPAPAPTPAPRQRSRAQRPRARTSAEPSIPMSSSGPSAMPPSAPAAVPGPSPVVATTTTETEKPLVDQQQPEKKQPFSVVALARDVFHQVRFGLGKLGDDTKRAFEITWHTYQHKDTPGWHIARRDARTVTTAKQDWARIVPFGIYAVLPFSFLFLPFILRVLPGVLPSGFRGKRIMTLVDRAAIETRVTLSPVVAAEIVGRTRAARDSTVPNDQFAATLLDALVDRSKATPPLPVRYSEILQALPVLRSYANLGAFNFDKSVDLARLAGISAPLLFPKTRLLLRLSAIRADDAMLRREHFAGLTHDEVVDACRVRRLPVPLHENDSDVHHESSELTDQAMVQALAEHAKFTEMLGAADVSAYVLAKALHAETFA
ncbi:LETM1-like protein-domain-containing protein [Blastocladiella britannica]|nr:LETM1-like protein-domain-containing protein [Blastocladiella britannica]